jgi:hypothetical protein
MVAAGVALLVLALALEAQSRPGTVRTSMRSVLVGALLMTAGLALLLVRRPDPAALSRVLAVTAAVFAAVAAEHQRRWSIRFGLIDYGHGRHLAEPSFVDDMRSEGRVHGGGRPSTTGRWSHLLADDPDELGDFFAGLGLRSDWIQEPGAPEEHYDVVEHLRRRAIAAGAVPTSYPLGTGNLIATKRLQACALDAPARGWHVFPLRPGTKVPAVRHWGHEATTDAEQIKELWSADLRRRDGWYVPEPRNVGSSAGRRVLSARPRPGQAQPGPHTLAGAVARSRCLVRRGRAPGVGRTGRAERA